MKIKKLVHFKKHQTIKSAIRPIFFASLLNLFQITMSNTKLKNFKT